MHANVSARLDTERSGAHVPEVSPSFVNGMEDLARTPRKTFLRSLLTQCQLLNEALGRGGVLSEPADDVKELLEKLPRPRSAMEEFIGRCVVARTLLGDRRLDAADGRRDRAVRRRVVEYCLGARTGSVAAWPGSTELLGLVRLLSHAGAQPSDDVRVAADVRRIVMTKYRENLTDSRIASAVGVSRAETTRAFRRVYGQSVRDFISDLRFAHARRLLQWTELKISAVAAEVGYHSPKDLYRLVKSRTGLTPAGLRQVERASSSVSQPRDPERPAAGLVQARRDF
jgi:AraC-like DNA-binding protein